MSEKPPKDPDEGLKRFLADLRKGRERRSWKERRRKNRRSTPRDVTKDRRSIADRRGGTDRRVMLLDRRHGNFEPYARQHAEEIRKMLRDPDATVACPRCEGRLLLGPSFPHGSGTAREVHCTACRHHVLVTDSGDTGRRKNK